MSLLQSETSWKPETSFKALVHEMMEYDMKQMGHTFFYTVADAARWRRLTRQAPQPPAQERTRNGQQVFPATRSRRTPKAPWHRPGALRLSSPRLASGASRRRS